MSEVQMLLAEQRTSLAMMRTGIAVLAMPLSVMSFLIATSKYYTILNVLHLMIPLAVLNSALIIFGVYLIVRSVIRMKHYEHFIKEIKKRNSALADLIE